jgi:hypothetical protein
MKMCICHASCTRGKKPHSITGGKDYCSIVSTSTVYMYSLSIKKCVYLDRVYMYYNVDQYMDLYIRGTVIYIF